jgi:MoaA/NifB/PqqE/SkfB family radical SAM enzyme
MLPRLIYRFLTEPDKRALFKFGYTFGWKGMRAVQKFKRRVREDVYFPPFLFLSITDKCNLRCQGCWVTAASPSREIDLEGLQSIVAESKKLGSHFFGILGGEPMLHPGLFDLFEAHPECYFLLFTNGTTITADNAARMRTLGNVSPLVSVEGSPLVSDERRGGRDVFEKTMRGLDLCVENRLITGVATSVCQSNYDDLVSDDFIRELISRGVLYLWYYVYRPVGPDPAPELALTSEQIVALRRFMVERRTRWPILIVDAYWDHEGKALCPAAVGISHHIGPGGYVEPCPPIQFGVENVNSGESLESLVTGSEFLRSFRDLARETTQGCILLDRPDLLADLLADLVEDERVFDSSGRGTALEELRRMCPRPSHHVPGEEIPEKHWFYRFAKRHWFFGFGAYG